MLLGGCIYCLTARQCGGAAHKGSGRAGVLQSAGSRHLLQNDLGLHTCDRLGVLVNKAVATRDGEDVLGSLQHASEKPRSKHHLL